VEIRIVCKQWNLIRNRMVLVSSNYELEFCFVEFFWNLILVEGWRFFWLWFKKNMGWNLCKPMELVPCYRGRGEIQRDQRKNVWVSILMILSKKFSHFLRHSGLQAALKIQKWHKWCEILNGHCQPFHVSVRAKRPTFWMILTKMLLPNVLLNIFICSNYTSNSNIYQII